MSNCCRKVWTDGSINNGKGDDSMIESYQRVVIFSRRCFSNKVSFFSTSMKLHFRFLVGFTDGRKRIHNSEVPPKIESFWRLRITSFQKCRHWRARHTVSLFVNNKIILRKTHSVMQSPAQTNAEFQKFAFVYVICKEYTLKAKLYVWYIKPE